MLGEPRQRIAGRRIHEEHEVGIQQQVYRHDRHRHADEQQHAAPQRLHLRADIARRKKHDRIAGQQNMDACGVQKHEISRRERRPCWKQQRSDRRRDADEIQIIIKRFIRPPRMNGNQENIDRAEVQRQICPVEIAAGKETDMLEQLVRQQQNGKKLPHLSPSGFIRPAVKNAAACGKSEKHRQRDQVARPKERKAVPFSYRLNRIEEVFHRSHLRSLFLQHTTAF